MSTAADDTPIPEQKRELRRRMREALARLGPQEREAESEKLRQRLTAEAEAKLKSIRRVMGFVSLPSEPDILPFLRALAGDGREVFLPRWNAGSQTYEPARMPADGNLVTGPFGVPEPPATAPAVSHEPLDLILVPGLAFDADGRRLGRGRGFYDRILAESGPARRWGVAFDLQIVEVVPCEMHDVKLDRIATPAFWLSNGNRLPS